MNRQTGNRLRHQLVDVVTGAPVQSSDKVRGYEIGENQFLLVDDDELKAAQLDARTRPLLPPEAPETTSAEDEGEIDMPPPGPTGAANIRMASRHRGNGRGPGTCAARRTAERSPD